MKRFEASTLEEAYAEAAKEFSCSITELDIQVVQNPSRGFLGFGRKSAIIVAAMPSKKRNRNKGEMPKRRKQKASSEPRERVKNVVETRAETEEKIAKPVAEETERVENKEPKKEFSLKRDDEIFGNFYTETPDITTVVAEIEKDINDLFEHACFDIEPIRVSVFNDETVLVEFHGNDAALLIGKEGYRYKALAYLLYNWIHSKYGYKVRLEIAEFLQNQEAMIENYLQPVIERIENEGRGQTKVLDGILVQIALTRLRDYFPDKYVAVRTNREGGRYIIVNEFMERK